MSKADDRASGSGASACLPARRGLVVLASPGADSVVTRGADTTKFSEPTEYTGPNGGEHAGNGDATGETEAAPVRQRPITRTPPN